TKLAAQYAADYASAMMQGKTETEATELAASHLKATQASAYAEAQKTVQASQDNLDKIKAQGTSMEGVVDATIAYRNALDSGASALQANTIYANTLEASMARAAQ